MEKKKKALIKWRFFSVLVVAAICYGTGAWEEWNWNPGCWRVDYREGFSIAFGVIGMLTLFGSTLAASGDNDTNVHL